MTWGEADRAALETAFRLREVAAAPVTIEVVAVGPRGVTQMLRDAVSLGADRVRLVVPEAGAVTPDCAAAAVAQVLHGNPPYDLILGGSGGSSGSR